MVVKLDPRIPLVWRNPDSLQVGVDVPVLILDAMTDAEQRVIAALVTGVSRSGLEMIARAAGGTDLEALLTELRPAMLSPTDRSPLTVIIDGSGPTADGIAGLLPDRMAESKTIDDARGREHLAVIIAHHVIDPHRHGGWLRRDIPHLPIVFGDVTVRIGPLVEPGIGPCLYCLELERTDRDWAWPAIAAQLLGRSAATETPLVAREVASIAARVIAQRIERGHRAGAAGAMIELDVLTGERSTRVWLPHPDCGCGGLSAAPPETGTACVPAPDRSSFAPTTGGADDAPG